MLQTLDQTSYPVLQKSLRQKVYSIGLALWKSLCAHLRICGKADNMTLFLETRMLLLQDGK
jgi:hypothetical protein